MHNDHTQMNDTAGEIVKRGRAPGELSPRQDGGRSRLCSPSSWSSL